MTRRLNPYLNFRDNAREAMQFYQSVFGGELDLQTLGEGSHFSVSLSGDEEGEHRCETGDRLARILARDGRYPSAFGWRVDSR